MGLGGVAIAVLPSVVYPQTVVLGQAGGGCAFDMEEGAGNGDKRKKRMKKEKNPVINLHTLVFFVILYHVNLKG